MENESRQPIILLGGGGHAAVVAETALVAGFEILGYCADDIADPSPAGLPRLGTIAEARGLAGKHGTAVHAAVGDAAMRRNWLISVLNVEAAIIVHPSAIVSPSARVNPGVYIGAGAVINARAVIEQGAIINTSAIIEHDCTVGEFSHIAPRAVLAGNVTVGRDVLIGAGAIVVPRKRIGNGATVGAGAVVIGDVAEAITVVGVPARPVGSYHTAAQV